MSSKRTAVKKNDEKTPIMNAPQPYKRGQQHEIAVNFILDRWPHLTILPDDVEALAELLLHVYKSGALGQRDLFYKMISRVQQHRLGSIHDIRMTKWFGSLPDFNVPYPIPETLPTEEKN